MNILNLGNFFVSGVWNEKDDPKKEGKKAAIRQKTRHRYMDSEGNSCSMQNMTYQVTKYEGMHPSADPKGSFYRSIWKARDQAGQCIGNIVMSYVADEG